mmetsp:Transcript_12934/g.24633  ORF Transcript_12934/g.24633 Transcript_12934/m.24633 type:complete len:219 (+) Transcript_12934:672-1328(+)
MSCFLLRWGSAEQVHPAYELIHVNKAVSILVERVEHHRGHDWLFSRLLKSRVRAGQLRTHLNKVRQLEMASPLATRRVSCKCFLQLIQVHAVRSHLLTFWPDLGRFRSLSCWGWLRILVARDSVAGSPCQPRCASVKDGRARVAMHRIAGPGRRRRSPHQIRSPYLRRWHRRHRTPLPLSDWRLRVRLPMEGRGGAHIRLSACAPLIGQAVLCRHCRF